jgi:hypothetical protein
MSLVAELMQRKVFRVAATYAVVAWLLIQVSATVEAGELIASGAAKQLRADLL